MSQINEWKFFKSRNAIETFLKVLEMSFVNDYERWKRQYDNVIKFDLWPYTIPSYDEFCIAILNRYEWYLLRDKSFLLDYDSLVMLALYDLQDIQWNGHKKRLDINPTF